MEIVIQSDTKYLSEVEAFISFCLSDEVLNDEIKNNIIVSIIEAVTNAIIHGNKRVYSKKVRINVRFIAYKFVVEVQDEGKGFNYKNVPDPLENDRLLEPNGRGLFIMNRLAESVVYSGNGNTVKLTFNLKL